MCITTVCLNINIKSHISVEHEGDARRVPLPVPRTANVLEMTWHSDDGDYRPPIASDLMMMMTTWRCHPEWCHDGARCWWDPISFKYPNIKKSTKELQLCRSYLVIFIVEVLGPTIYPVTIEARVGSACPAACSAIYCIVLIVWLRVQCSQLYAVDSSMFSAVQRVHLPRCYSRGCELPSVPPSRWHQIKLREKEISHSWNQVNYADDNNCSSDAFPPV